MSILVTAPEFGEGILLKPTKIAGLIAVSNELLKHSQAEEILRRDMLSAQVEAADRRLLDPTSDAASGIRPAAITHGAVEIDATGADTPAEIDGVVSELVQILVARGSDLTRVRLITRTETCLALAMLRNRRIRSRIPAWRRPAAHSRAFR